MLKLAFHLFLLLVFFSVFMAGCGIALFSAHHDSQRPDDQWRNLRAVARRVA